MRKFLARWWMIEPTAAYDAAIEEAAPRAEVHAGKYASELSDCEWLHFIHQARRRAPVIGTFDPMVGDLARDFSSEASPLRMWVGDRWYPYFEMLPQCS